ncbi:CoA transferase [Polymorphobacter glacialis]|uniref:CoA transferase n=1 Tax=Sandarakinorhabdus glacialis TaxID=1614636 RepID=A0A916ZLF9_9SPHN|nr:CoA transferase [Polymorphobacter glacialis]GGE03225.1 CoA transferase [Polymorphobacter glacialis]
MAGPLAGIKIVDLSQIVSGPMATALLADQGAEVIKVESPGGDPVRTLGPRKGDRSAMFIAVNRGKQGLAIDLKTRGGRTILERLVLWADVLVENFRPGTMERLGFGAERCAELNPQLIFASITGFGPDGPYRNIRVYDPVVQAVSGIAATQVDAKGQPSLVRTLVADKVTALTAAQAITAALFHRERTGEAQRIDVAMLDAALAFNWPEGMYNHSFVEPAAPFPEYGALGRLWQAADGQVAIGMMQDVEFIALARALGREDLAADTRLHTVGGRLQYRDDWAPAFTSEIAARTMDELMEGFISEGAVGGRVNDSANVADDPQVMFNEIVVEIDHGAAGAVRAARPAARFGVTPALAGGAAPALGEHGRAVLAGLGFSAAEIAGFAGEGALVG